MIPRLIKPVLLSKRIPPLLTLLLGPVVLALSIVVVLSKGSNNLQENYVLELNTSTLLQNVLKTYPAPSVAARAINPEYPMITAAPEIDPRQLFPKPEQVNSWFQSVGSQISTALRPTGTPTPGSSPGSGLAGIFPAVGGGNAGAGNGTIADRLRNAFGELIRGGSFTDVINASPLGPALNQLGGQAATAVVDLVNGAIAGFAENAGLADQYTVYLRDVCSANVTAEGSQTLGPQTCRPLRELSLGPAQPSNSTFQIGNVMVDYSAINIPNKLSGAGPLLRLLFDALFGFQITGIVATGLLLLISPLLVFSYFQVPFLRAIAGVLSVISAIFLALVTVIEALIGSILPNLVNKIGDGLGVSGNSGGKFLALVAISAAFSGILAQVWIVNLIVSYHERTYVRRDKELITDVPVNRGYRRPIIRLDNNAPSVEKTFSPRPAPRPFWARFAGSRNRPNKRSTVA